MKLTPLELARNAYANANKELHKPGLTGKDRAFLVRIRDKAKLALQAAHTVTADAANEAVPTPAVVIPLQTVLPTIDGRSDNDDPDHRAFCYYCIPGSQQAAVLVDRIYTQWLAFRSFQRRPSEARLLEYRHIIEGVIANVLYAVALDFQGVFITRDQSVLAKRSRYRPEVYNQTLLSVLDDLHAMGIVEQVKGQKWKWDHATTTARRDGAHARSSTRRTGSPNSAHSYTLLESLMF